MLGVNTAWLSVLALAIAALPFTTRAGTFTSDFTKGVDTNYWGLWTANAPADGYTNIIDAQGVTFQRFADPATGSEPVYSGGLSLGGLSMQKITTGGVLSGDFAVTMSYTNLNHFVSSTYSFWVQGINRMKLRLFRGDGGAPERVHEVGAFSTSRSYYGTFYKTAFQGCFEDFQYPWQAGQILDFEPAVFGNAATLKLARTNGVLSYYVNDQQLGVGEGDSTSEWTTNDIWGVELMLGQEWETAHIGVTFQSCSISGPSVKDSTSVPAPVLTLSPGGGGISFSWDTTIGQIYRVQSATNLVNPDWQPVGDPITATNSPTSVSYPVASESLRFYRVVTP